VESLGQLNAYSADEFELWLCKQLRALYTGTPDEKYRACDFRQLGISRGDSHLDGLQGLFKLLSDDARVRFKKALELTLRHAIPNDFPGEALADIVTLIGITEAYGAFPAFAAVLGCGPWGEIRPALIYDALSVLMMFDRSEEAYAAAKGLATSTYFPNALVFDAYLVMIHSEPKNWLDDYTLLRERFERVIQGARDSGNQSLKAQLTQRQRGLAIFMSKLPLEVIGRRLADLKIPADTWLRKHLLCESGPLALLYDNPGNAIIISARDIPERRAAVKTTSSLEVLGFNSGLLSGGEYPTRDRAPPLDKKSADRLERLNRPKGNRPPNQTSAQGAEHAS